jgi:antitoxin component HigA of HigAB toxin-antitoxin module
MTWMATAIAGSAVVGAISANKASSTQADAASKAGDLSKLISDDQIALAREQFNAQALNQEPFRQGGLAAQNQLMKLLGLTMPISQTANLLSSTAPATATSAPNLGVPTAQTADERIKANWDETAYLKAHPDVAAELSTGKSASGQNTQITSGYDHFIKYGQAGGYQPTLTAAPGLTVTPPATTTPGALAAFKIAQPAPVTTTIPGIATTVRGPITGTIQGPEISRVKGAQINSAPTYNGLSYALNSGLSQADYDREVRDAFIRLEAQGATDSMFRSQMEAYGVSPDDLARATGSDPAAVAARYNAATPQTAAEIAYQNQARADLATRQQQDPGNFAPDIVTYGPDVYTYGPDVTTYGPPTTKTTQGVNTVPTLADVQKYFQENPGLSDSQIKTLLARENIPVALLAQATNTTEAAWAPRLASATAVAQAAPTVADIQAYAQKYPNLSWPQIQQFMQTNKITPELMSQALNVPVADINAKISQAPATRAANLSNSVGLNYALSNGLSQAQYDAEIKDFVVKNQGKLSNSMLKSEMDRYGISTADMARATGGDLTAIQSIYDTSKATTPEEISYEKAAQADLVKRQNEQLANQNAAIAQENATGFGALTKPFQMRMGSTTPGEAGPVFDPGTLLNNFTQADYEADPGYAFRFSEGQKALDKSMAARGLGISGANIKGAVKYGQDMGSQEYNNAYNRFQTNRANQSDVYNTAFNRDQVQRNALLNPLQSLMGSGQSATNQVNNASNAYTTNVNNATANYGTNATNALTGGANARASGYVGTANALTNAVGQGINYNNMGNQNALYASMFNNGGTTTMNPALNAYFQPG